MESVFPAITAGATGVLAVAAIGLIIRPFKTIEDKIEGVRKEARQAHEAIGQNIKELGGRLERRMDLIDAKIDQQGRQLTELTGALGEIRGAIPQINYRISNLEGWNSNIAGKFKDVSHL